MKKRCADCKWSGHDLFWCIDCDRWQDKTNYTRKWWKFWRTKK